MPEPAQLFLYSIILQATEEEPAEVYMPLQSILAATPVEAEEIAGRVLEGVPEELASRAEITVRPF
jgi:hypothetical protein